MLKNYIEFFTKHVKITNWIMIVILLAGAAALSSLNVRVMPKMDLQGVQVNIPYPGASAREVEEGIITKVEESLRGLEGLGRIYSGSQDGYGWVYVEILPSIEMIKAIDRIRNAVNSIATYPVDAEKPVIYQDTMWQRVAMLTIYGDTDLLNLKRIADEFRDELTKTGKVSLIRSFGTPPREIVIEVSPTNLERYGLTIGDIGNAIRATNLNISSGSILTDRERIQIRSYEKKYEAEQLEDIPIISSIEGRQVTLREIASIREQWPDNWFYEETDGKQTIDLHVMYSNDEDVLDIADLLDKKIIEFEERYGGLIHIDQFIKDTDELRERISTLIKNGLLGLVMVVVILSFFLNLRLAFWVALGIPISFMGTFFAQWLMGITINEMSLFGLILVLGILVDDGIVIAEAIFVSREKDGLTGVNAAVAGTMEVIKPVFISILTTMVAFLPFFALYGDLRNYTWQIAFGIVVALGFSLLEASTILPAHLAHSKALTSPPGKGVSSPLRRKLESRINHFIENIYGPFLKTIMHFRWSLVAATVAGILVMAGAFAGTHIKAQFFPDIESPYAQVRIELPLGINTEIANQIREEAIQRAMAFGETRAQPEDGYENAILSQHSWMNGNTISVFMVLIPAVDRDYTVKSFSDDLSEALGEFPYAENVQVGSFSFGGSPISVRFLSMDYDALLKAKELLKEELKAIDGVKDIRDDTPLGTNELVVNLKPRGEALGLTVYDVSNQLRQGFYGQEVMRLQRGRDEVKIWVRFPESDRQSISQMENIKIRTPAGSFVPFKEIADYKMQRSLQRIRHEDGYRAVSIHANMDYTKNDLAVVQEELNGVTIPRVLAQVDGVTTAYGGQNEFVRKSTESIQFTLILAIVAMFTILMFLMKSYAQAFLVIGLIPLGTVGAVAGHAIMGLPVSFLSFLGIIALGGIIVNDSVVLIDRYNNLKVRVDIKPSEAIYMAGLQRFRPIIMTTLTTAAGLAPLIFQKSEGGQFLVPMAVSVAFGVVFGTFLTLFMLPAVLLIIDVDLPRFRSKIVTFFKGA
jgi:multidrug efflux pump subunit AcrB